MGGIELAIDAAFPIHRCLRLWMHKSIPVSIGKSWRLTNMI